MKENSLKKDLILKKRNDIVEVLKNGRRFGRGSVRLILLRRDIQSLKIAFLVSKKYGRKAVLRNKIKRWFREIFRQNKACFPVHAHIIMTSAVSYEDLDFTILKNDFLEVVRSEEFTDFISQILPESNIPVKEE
ncbi:MAG: ribonuclease P protein component [Candidatus Delongbacteria bacterium]|nr:ribonuclease P protein component [Candidatus Delongbacteria bacterium]